MSKLDEVNRVSFYRAIKECHTEDELIALFHDLSTELERNDFQSRWEIAQSKLATDCSKNTLKQYHKVSSELVNRVVKELYTDKGDISKNSGYRIVYRRIHGSPADEI